MIFGTVELSCEESILCLTTKYLQSSWMEHIPSWEDSIFRVIQEISALYKSLKFGPVLARTHV